MFEGTTVVGYILFGGCTLFVVGLLVWGILSDTARRNRRIVEAARREAEDRFHLVIKELQFQHALELTKLRALASERIAATERANDVLRREKDGAWRVIHGLEQLVKDRDLELCWLRASIGGFGEEAVYG